MLFLTDGNETCAMNPIDPGDAAAALLGDPMDPDVRTFVVGFGLSEEEQALDDIAQKGGTVEPILPRNKTELVEKLARVLAEIQPETRAFAAASTPAAQSSTADKIYLSSFVPQAADNPSPSIWPGRTDAFHKPLPLTASNRPDFDRICTTARPVGCHLWEAGRLLVTNQSPSDTEIDAPFPDFRIGDLTTERRVFYPQGNPLDTHPGQLTLFQPPKTDMAGDPLYLSDVIDLAEVVDPDALTDYLATLIDEATLTTEVIAEINKVLRRKKLYVDSEALFGGPEFVMGDVFHAQPLVIDSPSELRYFASDLCGRIQPEDTPSNWVAGEDRGYRRYTQENS